MSGEGEAEGVQQPEERGDEGKNGQQTPGHIAALNALKQSYVDAHEGDERKEFWRGFREYLTIALVLITVVFTGLTYWIFRQTMLDARDSARDSHLDNLRAEQLTADAVGQSATVAIAAQQSASVAKQAYSLSQENAVRQFSANLGFGVARLTKFTAGEIPHAALQLVTTGLPKDAAILSGLGALPLPPADPDEKNVVFVPCNNLRKSPYVQILDVTMATATNANLEKPITQQSIDEIKAGRLAIYFIGRVCYRDGFHPNRFQDFCLYWTGPDVPNNPALFCPKHNSGK